MANEVQNVEKGIIYIQDITFGGKITITDNDLYDVIILPAAEGVANDGRVISVHNSSNSAQYDGRLESYALSLGKNNATLTIGGNVAQNAPCFYQYITNRTVPSYEYQSVLYDLNHNIAHYTINSSSLPQGAVYFYGENANLVLTAQSGASYANKYNHHPDYVKDSNDEILKKDDDISIYSENLGFYCNPSNPSTYNDSGFKDNKDTINYTIYAEHNLTVESDLVGKLYSYAAALHVGYSEISSNGIVYVNDSSDHTVRSVVVKADNLTLDSNFRANVISVNGKDAVDKRETHEYLEGENFDTYDELNNLLNSSDRADYFYSYNEVIDYSQSLAVEDGVALSPNVEYFYLEEKDGTYTQTFLTQQEIDAYNASINSGKTNVGVIDTEELPEEGGDGSNSENTEPVKKIIYYFPENYLQSLQHEVKGTTIVNIKEGGSPNNTIDSYGILVDGNLTQKSSIKDKNKKDIEVDYIWAGSIYSETSYASVIASYKYSHEKEQKMVQATAENNTIASWGIKVGGTLELEHIGSIKNDSNELQNATISVLTQNSQIVSEAKDPEGKNATASVANSIVSAIGIEAKTIQLGTVSKLDITSNFLNNKMVCTGGLLNGHTFNDITGFLMYNAALKAEDIILNHFDGANLTVKTQDNDNYVLTYGIHATSTLKSISTMRGTIKVESDLSSMDSTAEVSFNYGIWAKNITINGSLSTKIILNSISTSQNRAFVGIYTENFVASELSSQISRSANGSDGFRGIGLNVNGTLSSYIKGDSFDFNGNIHLTEGYAIATNHTLNLRVSGTINVDNYWWADNLYGEWGYAIRAEHAASSLSNIVMIAKEKHDDIVEFSSTAKVNGIIDLYAGINQYFINSNAEITGNLRATNGAANIVFYLDNEQSNHATLNVTSVNDVTLYDSNTIVVNLNYAVEDVKYDLIKYDSTYGVEADSYWCAEDRNRQVSFVYQGVTKSFTLPSQIGQDTNNTFEINFSDNAFMRVVADYNRDTDTFSVTVTEISGNIPQVVAPFDDKSRKYFIESVKYDAEKCTLDLDWNALYAAGMTAKNYNLANIVAYEVEYQRYDSNGNKEGESVILRVTDSKCSILGVDKDTSISWRIRILGDTGANSVTQWSSWQTYNSFGVDGFANVTAAGYVVEYGDIVNKIITNQANYDINDGVKYYLEYQLWDENGKKKGELKQVVVTGTSYLIEAISNQKYVDWRVGVGFAQGSNNEDIQWSDWNKGNKFTLIDDRFESEVADSSLGFTGVVSAVAEVKFSEIISEKAIRNYVIEYFADTALVSEETAQNLGFESLQDYIATNQANGYFAGKTVYTKTFTGTSITLSDIQDQVYVYWRIKAIDVDGNESAWYAGNTFRVWCIEDTVNPTIEDKNKKIDHLSITCTRPEDPQKPTNVSGTLVWNAAKDDQSGIRSYHITVADGNNKNGKEYIIYAEDKTSYYGYSAKVKKFDGFASDKTYGMKINGEICRVEIIDNGSTLTIKWGSVDNLDIKSIELYEFEGFDDTQIEWSSNPIKTWNNLSEGDTLELNKTIVQTKYDYHFTFTDLNFSSYTYTIVAQDYFNNTVSYGSGSFVIDKKSPSFKTRSVNVERNGNVADNDVTLIPTFSWEAADDASGILCYVVRYKKVGTSEWIEKTLDKDTTSYTIREKLEPAEYQYEIIAYDIFNNSTTLDGRFGSADIVGPVGSFIQGSLSANLDVEFETVTSQDPEFETEEITEVVLKEASATFSWVGDFDDKTGVMYKVQFSDNEEFTTIYEFWTNEESITFDQTTVGRPISLFETFKSGKIHWRVQAFDTTVERNPNPTVVTGTPLEFKDVETGLKPQGSAPVAPMNINVTNAGKESVENTSIVTNNEEISLSWETPYSITGIYYFNIYIYDENGKLLAKADTLELNNPNGVGHLDSLLNVTDKGTSTEFRIDDLGKLFANFEFLDRKYLIRISAVDGAGRETFHANNKKNYYQFIQDTVAPNIDNVTTNCIAQADNVKCTVIIKWDPAVSDTDGVGSGIDYYLVSIRTFNDKAKLDEEDPNGELGWYEEKVTSGTTFQYSYDYDKDVKYEFKIVAVDNAGNIGKTYYSQDDKEEGYSLQLDGFVGSFDLIDRGADQFDINNETIGGADKADCFKLLQPATSGYLNIYINNHGSVVGTSKQITVEVFSGDNLSKAIKTYTVKADKLLSSDLYLEAGKDYYFRVKEANGSAITAYDIHLSKTDETMSFENEGQINHDDNNKLDQTNIADFVKVDISTKGRYSFNLTSDDSLKLTLFKVVNGKISNIGSITSGKELSNVILEEGVEYYYQVTPTTSTVTKDYSYNVTGTFNEAFPVDEIIVNDNNWNDTQISTWNVNTEKSGVVSCQDKKDFYKLKLDNSGSYNFVIESKDGDFTEPVKLIVYELVDDKKLVSLGSVSVKLGTSIAYISKELLLNKDNVYYVEVQSSSSTWGSEYTLSSTHKSVGGDETGDNVWKDNNSLETISSNTQTSDNEWVGFNDLSDYRKVDLANSGEYYFRLEGVLENTLLNVYAYDENTNKLKKLTSVTAKAESVAQTTELMLNREITYYVEVAATNGKVLGTNYQLGMFNEAGKVFDELQEQEIAVAPIQPEQAPIENWVGFNDTADSYLVELERSGEYNFELSGIEENAIVTVYEEVNGNKKKLTSITVKDGKSDTTKNLILSKDTAINYYVEVSIANKNVLGTDYSLTMNTIGYALGEEFGDDKWQNLSSIPEEAHKQLLQVGSPITGEWLGYNDNKDYHYIDLTSANDLLKHSGKYSFTLSGITENATLTIYEQVGENLKKIKSISVKAYNKGSINDLMLDANSNYYAEVTIANKNVLGTSYNLSFDEVKLANGEENHGSVSLDANAKYATITEADQASDSDWVGFNDPKDYRKVEISNSGLYKFNLFDVTENTSLTIYEYVNGKFKKLTSVTVKAGTVGQTTGLLLDAAKEYYVEVSAVNTKVLGTEYTVDLEAIKLVGSEENHGTSLNYKKAYATITEADQASDSDWVGFNDPSDYRKVEIANSGIYQFDLFNVTENTSLTIYEYVNGKFQKLTSVTVKGGTSGKTAGLLLDAAKEYYVEVSAVNTKVLGTNYTLDLTQIKPAGGEENYGTKLDVNEAYATITEADQASDSDWVGFNDPKDYRKVEISNSGLYQFNLSGVTETTSLTIYELVDGKFKKLTSITVKAGATNQTAGLLLDAAKEYYAEVSAVNTKVLGTQYTLDLELLQPAVGEENHGTSLNYKKAYDTITVAEYENDWVGFNDPSDYRKVEISNSGLYQFNLFNVDEKTSLTIYEYVNGKFQKLTSITVKAGTSGKTAGLLLDAAKEYYVEVSAVNTKVLGTEYTVDLELLEAAGGEENHGTKLDVNETYATITDTDQASDRDWVGFNDTADYRLIDLNGISGKFNFELNGVSANTILNIYEVVDGNVKKLTSVTAKDGKDAMIKDLMLDGSSTSNKTYYAEVVVANKNAFGTAYELDMELSKEVEGYASDNVDAVELVAGSKITDDWVGFNNLSDYRELVGFTTGEGTLTLTAEGNVTLTVFDESGKKLASISTTASKTTATTKAINFVEGTNYYIEVKSSNATAFGTTYDVSFDANLDTDFASDRVDAILTDILGQSQFVGNKDTEDIFEVALNADGELKLNFETSVGEINLALYDSNGRTVKCDIKDGILTSDMIVAGEYFLRVTAKESSEAIYTITLA